MENDLWATLLDLVLPNGEGAGAGHFGGEPSGEGGSSFLPSDGSGFGSAQGLASGKGFGRGRGEGHRWGHGLIGGSDEGVGCGEAKGAGGDFQNVNSGDGSGAGRWDCFQP